MKYYNLFANFKYSHSVVSTTTGKNLLCGCILTAYRQYHKSRLLYPSSNILKFIRGCTGNSNRTTLPFLTNFPVVYWPTLIKYAKNSILSRFIIQKYLDNNFTLDGFIAGSKHAVGVVSDYISKGDLKGLNDLVTPNVIEEMKMNLLKFSLKQVLELKINPDDIYFSVPYEIGIMLPDENDRSKRFVEITMCYHVLSGYKEMAGSPDFSLQSIDFEDKLYILNYRFCKDFSEGVVDSQWIINALNHIKPLVNVGSP